MATTCDKLTPWLTPLSWLYGAGVALRNWLFDIGILRQQAFAIPIISVGNIAVGGAGKTPHVEYLITLLHRDYKVAVLSRGYKRKTKGFVLATDETHMLDIGDEPYQIKKKFPDVYVAVDHDRCRCISRLLSDSRTSDVDVVLLDDAYQHRYVKRGMNILLIDYHRMMSPDHLLPAGRLREPMSTLKRADTVIITKCPSDLNPTAARRVANMLPLRPEQKLFFSTITYTAFQPFYGGAALPLASLTRDHNILLFTGIAMPELIEEYISSYTKKMRTLSFHDHHYFTHDDIMHISRLYNRMKEPKMLITTEKDACRLRHIEEVNYSIGDSLYVLPIEITFLHESQTAFDNLVRGHVRDILFDRRMRQRTQSKSLSER